MKTLFVQVKCDLGESYKTAAAAIEDVDFVSEVYSTSGQFDLLLKCYLPENEDVGHFVTEQIQKLPGVRDTFTTLAFKAF